MPQVLRNEKKYAKLKFVTSRYTAVGFNLKGERIRDERIEVYNIHCIKAVLDNPISGKRCLSAGKCPLNLCKIFLPPYIKYFKKKILIRNKKVLSNFFQKPQNKSCKLFSNKKKKQDENPFKVFFKKETKPGETKLK